MMKLGMKTLIFAGVVMVALLVLWAVYYVSASSSLSNLEESFMQDDITRTSRTISFAVEDVDHLLSDWAHWDDSYEFATDQNQDYRDSNFAGETLGIIETDALIIANRTGHVIAELYSQDLSACENALFETDSSTRPKLRFSFSKRADADSRESGLLVCDEAVLLFAARPILTTESKGPANGAMLFGRLLSGHVDALKEQLLLDIEIYPLDSKRLPEDFQDALSIIDKPDESADDRFISFDKENIYGYKILNDYQGRPGAVLKVSKPRTLALHERKMLYTLTFFLVFGGAVLVLLFLLFVREIIIKRIMRLHSFFSNVIQTQDLSKRAKEDPERLRVLFANDEICGLGRNINVLLKMLEDSQKSQAEQADEVLAINDKLLETDRLKEVLFSNISHELKTPLTAVRAYNQLLYDGSFGKINAKQKEMLEIVLHSTDYLNEIISELLELSRFEAGKAKLLFEKIDLKTLIRETVRDFAPNLKQVKGRVNISCPKKFVIEADGMRLKEVFQNLVSNSIKYRDIRDLVVNIRCWNNDDGTVSISVEDNAKGIADEDMEHIFDRFYQIDKNVRTGEFESTGLGLSILKHIVEAHGGSVRIESALGVGTTFLITLPKKKATPVERAIFRTRREEAQKAVEAQAARNELKAQAMREKRVRQLEEKKKDEIRSSETAGGEGQEDGSTQEAPMESIPLPTDDVPEDNPSKEPEEEKRSPQ